MITWTLIEGASLRLSMLMTYYRHDLNWTEKRKQEVDTILERWLKVAEPCTDNPPLEVLVSLTEDLNISKIIALMHVYRKNKEGKKLFATLNFLGFFNEGVCSLDDWRTLPEGQGSSNPGLSSLGKC